MPMFFPVTLKVPFAATKLAPAAPREMLPEVALIVTPAPALTDSAVTPPAPVRVTLEPVALEEMGDNPVMLTLDPVMETLPEVLLVIALLLMLTALLPAPIMTPVPVVKLL